MKCDDYLYNRKWKPKNYFGYFACTSGRKWYDRLVIKWALQHYYWTDILKVRYLLNSEGGLYKVNRFNRKSKEKEYDYQKLFGSKRARDNKDYQESSFTKL